MQRSREFGNLCGNQVIGDKAGQQIKPEEGDLREDLSLTWNSCSQNMIEGGDSVCGYEQQGIVNRVKIAHFTAAKEVC
jgi:hypothetical protein